MARTDRDDALLYGLDLKGYAIVRSALEPELLDALEGALRRLESAGAAELPSACPATWTPVLNERRLLNVVECGAPFERLIDHPALLAVVELLVPAPQRLTEAFSITRARGAGVPLHRIDTAAYRLEQGRPICDHLTAAVFLSDCGPEDGPFVVLEGSHKSYLPLPYKRIHPSWPVPEHDAAFAARAREEERDLTALPWEEIPGYRELHVRRGDVIFLVQSLWHGAREIRSARVRRSLYYSYSPYHLPNWHGITYSQALKERTGRRRRELLEGPFIGHRYAGVPSAGLPDSPHFPVLPESSRPPRAFGAAAPAHLEEDGQADGAGRAGSR